MEAFRRRHAGGEQRHTSCRECHNRRARELAAINRVKRDRGRLRVLLLELARARDEASLMAVCSTMLDTFGGLPAFAAAFANFVRQAQVMARKGRPAALFKTFDCTLRVMAIADEVARRQIPGLSDKELRERLEAELLRLVATRPERLADFLRSQGWSVECLCNDEVESSSAELARTGG